MRKLIELIRKNGKSIHLWNNKALVDYRDYILKVTFRDEEEDAEVVLYYKGIQLGTIYIDDFKLDTPIYNIEGDFYND